MILLNTWRKKIWFLKSEENNWLCFEFKYGKVSMNGYSWESDEKTNLWDLPISFIWEGSDNNSNWTTIDSKDNNRQMGTQSSHYCSCPKSPFYKYIRFRLVTVQYSGYLYSRHLELFGEYMNTP